MTSLYVSSWLPLWGSCREATDEVSAPQRKSKAAGNRAFYERPHPSRLRRATVSLRLGHPAALTRPRRVIHYRWAASLPHRGRQEIYETHSAAAERKASRGVWIIEENKAVQREILLPRHSAAARFLCLSSTASDAFFLFFHEKEKKEWGAEKRG